MASDLEIKVVVDNTKLIQAAIRDGIKDAITKACFDVEAEAKNTVPVDTGNLKNSIQADLDNIESLEGEVGTGVEYAAYIEYGTSKMPARPYLTPAAEKVAGSFTEVVTRLINSKMKD